jgi:aryl-alcohol dehydrogenase-like predicted oxidoreductase
VALKPNPKETVSATTLVGGRSPQQVDGWIGAASLQLTIAHLQEISDAIVRTGAGEGPTIPQLEHAVAAH